MRNQKQTTILENLINRVLFRDDEVNISVYKNLLTLSRALSIIEEETKYTPGEEINIMRVGMLRSNGKEGMMLQDEEAVWDYLEKD